MAMIPTGLDKAFSLGEESLSDITKKMYENSMEQSATKVVADNRYIQIAQERELDAIAEKIADRIWDKLEKRFS